VPLFEDLLSAFGQDVTVTRYAALDDVLDYSRRSANPVGRLVLRIAGYDDPRLDGWSDAICSALQLTNFWQDLRIDFERGRIYLPAEELRSTAPTSATLAAGCHAAWRAALAAAVRARGRCSWPGVRCAERVAGRLKHELRATWLGGMRVLSRIERADFDVVARRPRLARRRPWLVWNVATWRATRSSLRAELAT
jgi:phytoene/squalene synthetase